MYRIIISTIALELPTGGRLQDLKHAGSATLPACFGGETREKRNASGVFLFENKYNVNIN
jgi:hypothetical protein